jgi:hypothetical protein
MSAAVTLRPAPGGRVQFQGCVEDLPPDQLVKLRAYKDELAPIIAAYREVEIVIRPATPVPPALVWPPKPKLPTDWLDLDGWRALLGRARLVEHRRWVVARWARAADGDVSDGVLDLPTGLPHGLALAELKTHARICGLTIENLR